MGTSFYTQEELLTIGFKNFGENVLISRKASIYSPEEISIGNNVRIDDFCLISGKINIGNFVHIAAYSAIFAGHTGVTLGNYTGISARTIIYAETDDYSGLAITNPTVPVEWRNVLKNPVLLKDHAIVGAGSIILPGCTLEEGVAVGAMSLINKSLTAWSIYAGVPCKKIKERKKDLLNLI